MTDDNSKKKKSSPEMNKIDSLVEVDGLPVDSAIPDQRVKKIGLGKYTLNQQSMESQTKISGDTSRDGKRFKTILASSASANARPPMYTRVQHKRVASGGTERFRMRSRTPIQTGQLNVDPSAQYLSNKNKG